MRFPSVQALAMAAALLLAAGAAPPPNGEPGTRNSELGTPSASSHGPSAGSQVVSAIGDNRAAPADGSRHPALEEGWKELRYANWPKAQDLLERVRRESADPRERAEATFALANLWQFRRPGPKVERARELYEQVLGEHADTPVAPFAVMALARLADTPDLEKDRDPKRARELYERLLRDWPHHRLADEAVLRLALVNLQAATVPPEAVRGEMTASVPAADRDRLETEAARLLEPHLKARPTNILAAPMRIVLGNLYARRGRWQDAVDQWVAADAAGVPGLSDRATLYYRIARVAEVELGRYDVAARWYGRIVTDIRRDPRYYVALEAAERCRAKVAEAAAPGAGPSAGEGGR
jgi:tetratricopeptide (TPR) repeat protein